MKFKQMKPEESLKDATASFDSRMDSIDPLTNKHVPVHCRMIDQPANSVCYSSPDENFTENLEDEHFLLRRIFSCCIYIRSECCSTGQQQ